jgi:hypothetical protein
MIRIKCDDTGGLNGWNSKFFKPSTKEAFDAQNKPKSIEKWSAGSYVVFCSKFGDHNQMVGFIDKIVEYYYSISHNCSFSFINKVRRCYKNALMIDEKFTTGINNIYNIIHYNKDALRPLNLLELYKHKNKFTNEEKIVFELLSNKLELL